MEQQQQHLNLDPALLIEHSISRGVGRLSSTGALVIETGKFTGRSPKDRYIVKDTLTQKTVDWGGINIPIESKMFDQLFDKVKTYQKQLKEVYIRDAYACAHPKYRLNVRIYTEFPWQSLFVFNMFLRPTAKELAHFLPDWEVYAFPGVLAHPATDGTRQENFSILNFAKKVIIIGGTAYTGEIKKGIFSALNFLLPQKHQVLSMHCSASVGSGGDTALFFGLSGTGKTTLSNDPDRRLIGDDEHGWSKESIFNFEGGCYAKTIDLSETKEPQIYRAIKFGAMLENVTFFDDTCTVNYEDTSTTPNTRVSYPIYHIDNIMYNSRGDLPQNIFFLTCDAFGVLPPISKLTMEQAMYHFISGYTAKIAGTEEGIHEPQATFSACFGAPFLPLPPTQYASLLGQKIKTGIPSGDGQVYVWLVNTGWTGGPFGVGSRIELSFTRAMIKAALSGALHQVAYRNHSIFNLAVPLKCPDVPNAILNPRDTWRNESDYDSAAVSLANRFIENFKPYQSEVSTAVLKAGPELAT